MTITDLQDITDFPEAVVPRDAAGWRLRLAEDPGEKVLSEAITFDGTIFFTSFAPGGTVSACVGGLGVNRLYEVDACNGRPVNNLDGSTEPGPLGVDDRWRLLGQAGIAPGPAFLFTSPTTGNPTGCVGLECFPPQPGTGRSLRPTFWSQQQAADEE